MVEHGIDLTGAQAKHLDTFIGQRFDYAITLCDPVREVCPEFLSGQQPIHWRMPDPAEEPDGYPAFQRVASELADRIGFVMHDIALRTSTSGLIEEES
jgi:ArsR family transcriptional regulator, arsenate/arsenite/antimonite-responsive transcriptional repressor / arsenate reductase (thioredoxin)